MEQVFDFAIFFNINLKEETFKSNIPFTNGVIVNLII